MIETTTYSCANCRSPVPDTMRFCPNCGTPAAISQAPPPPSVSSYIPTQNAATFTTYPQQNNQPAYQAPPAQQGYQPPLQSVQPPPAYARPQKNSSRGMLRVALILLVLILLLGAGGYFAFHFITSRGGNTAHTGANSETTLTQAPLTTTPINTTVTYASVTITIINAQQAKSFPGDTGSPTQGVVRLNIHAVQSDVNNVYFASAPPFAYPESFALLLPGGSKVAAVGFKDVSGPTRNGDQTTWMDFPASTGLKVAQMVLQIGKDTEEQLQVPLTGHADLSQYQARQGTPNLRVPFGSMIWTLKTVTFKLSDSGTQVDKGMRFLVLSFSIDNPGTETDNGYPPDYIRLQYGATVIALDQVVIGTTPGGTIDPGLTNIQGLVSFLVPQDITTATFILLPGHLTPGATTQATISIQIP
jgi:zinc-ribbon domain